VWAEFLTTGLRLLLFAEATNSAPFRGSLDGFSLRPLALLAFGDELRRGAGAVLKGLAEQGIQLKILSGDHAETVRATIHTLDLPLATEPVISGDRLAEANDKAELLHRHSVFGRVSPRQKLEIVGTLQGLGFQVGMTGDGVNDVLPLKRANLGIAMGEGTRAAKTVAGIVLTNNDFGLLPATLAEGRTILRNLRRAGKLFLLKNVYTLILIVGTLGILHLPFPYMPRQVTLLNSLTIGIPALAITFSRERARVGPRFRFLHDLGWFAIPTGVLTGLAGLVILLLSARWQVDDVETQRTLLLSLLIVLGLGNLVRVLTDEGLSSLQGDSRLLGLPVVAALLFLVTLYWPLSADFFSLRPLSLPQWGLVMAVATPAFLLCKLTDRWQVALK
jgi:cation-transporting ATPase E